MEDRQYYANFSMWKRKMASQALKTRELEIVQNRKLWGAQGEDHSSTAYPTPVAETIAPSTMPRGVI